MTIEFNTNYKGITFTLVVDQEIITGVWIEENDVTEVISQEVMDKFNFELPSLLDEYRLNDYYHNHNY